MSRYYPYFWRGLTAFLLWGFVWSATAKAAPAENRHCLSWFKKKKYTEASRCFLALYQKYHKKPKRTDEEREKMGAALRNTALVLRKSAQSEKKVARAAYLRERSVYYFTLFLEQKLYISENQKRYTLVQRDSLKEKIGYARLTLLAPPKSKITITGYHFSLQQEGGWAGMVRPGRYSILTKQTNQTEVKEVVLQPGQPKIIRLTLPTPKGTLQGRKRTPAQPRVAIQQPPQAPQAQHTKPRWPWVLLGLGAAAAVTGGVLAGISFLTLAERDARLEQTLKKPVATRAQQDTQAVKKLHGQANGQLMAGIITGAVGVIAIALGGSLVSLIKTPAPTPSPTSPDKQPHTTLWP